MADFDEIMGIPVNRGTWKTLRRRLITVAVVGIASLVVLLLFWNSLFEYVPQGKHLVTIAKGGEPLPAGQVLAEAGQQGIQREVKGEGWHFVMPIVYETELAPNTEIKAGKVGIVTSRGGKPLPPGRVLAEPGEQGIQRRVLPPGTYRLNLHGFDVEQVDAVTIEPGFVGVMRRLLGKDGKGRFAKLPDEKGILTEVLQPGMYYINTKEFQILKTEVGIFQTTFHYDADPQRNTAITFVSKGGLPISVDCTVEWEVLPDDMPSLIAEYGSRGSVERNVVEVQAHAIGRDKGINYGIQSFLEGSKREAFQEDFAKELTRVCKEKSVTVRSAFIRNIVIPEAYLKPIREKQIAAETEITNKAKEATAKTAADVEREQQMVPQREAEVAAETKRLVAAIDREVENTRTLTEAEVEKLTAEFENKIAKLEANRVKLMGETKAEVTKLQETARNGLYQMKMDVFKNDNEAFLRYSMADALSPKLVLRLFQSGPGTFWTNMDGKGPALNLLLPTSGTSVLPQQPAPVKPATGKK